MSTMTEKQGDEIIKLLETLVESLGHISYPCKDSMLHIPVKVMNNDADPIPVKAGGGALDVKVRKY